MAQKSLGRFQSNVGIIRRWFDQHGGEIDAPDRQRLSSAIREIEEFQRKLQSERDKNDMDVDYGFIDDPDLIGETELK